MEDLTGIGEIMERVGSPCIAALCACVSTVTDGAAATARKQREAERRMLADPNYRMGDPTVHPDDRLGL